MEITIIEITAWASGTITAAVIAIMRRVKIIKRAYPSDAGAMNVFYDVCRYGHVVDITKLTLRDRCDYSIAEKQARLLSREILYIMMATAIFGLIIQSQK
jgi:hypothetical protein